MLFTSVPVQAFSAEEPAPRIPVSAPFEHPESVVYEAKQQYSGGIRTSCFTQRFAGVVVFAKCFGRNDGEYQYTVQ